jgi:hypothetical protein
MTDCGEFDTVSQPGRDRKVLSDVAVRNIVAIGTGLAQSRRSEAGLERELEHGVGDEFA